MDAGGSIVGREEHLSRIARFLDEVPSGPAAIVLEGEPGIGKTTLWRWGLERARERGFAVLTARPTDVETPLAFAGLSDLLAGILGRFDRHLPAPQRRAIRTVLLLEEGPPPDLRAVGTAFLGILRASGGPVLIAVDDEHWLDGPSRSVLGFAIRRLEGEPVGLLLSRRAGAGAGGRLRLDPMAAADRVATLTVGPLSLGALHRVLVQALGQSFPRPVLRKLHQTCGGNPLYAVEIARDMARRGISLGPGEDLPVPPALRALVADRLARLPEAALDACRIAAAMARPTVHLVASAIQDPEGAVDLAIAADVLEVDHDRLRFVHPLLASEALGGLQPEARRALHARIAGVVRDPEERAWHVAHSTTDPSADAAAALDAGAIEAAARGAPEAAAELEELAARLTPADDAPARTRRLISASEHLMAAGDPARARALLDDLVRALPRGRDRAAVLWRLADTIGDDLDRSVALCQQALEESGGDAALDVDIRLALALFEWLRGDLLTAALHDREAVAAAERSGDPALVAMALADLAHAEVVLGRPFPRRDLERAAELARAEPGSASQLRPTFQLGVLLMYTDQLDEARPLLEGELARASSAGDAAGRMVALYRLSELELRAGRFGAAERNAVEAISIAEQAGIEQEQGAVLAQLCLVLAHLGRVEAARDAGVRALRLAVDGGDAVVELHCRGALGFLDLSVGEARAAHAVLAPATEAIGRMGVGEFSISQVVHNDIEVLVQLGDLDAAMEVVRLIERRSRPTRRPWSLAMAARGRALVLSARGELDAARRSIRRALTHHPAGAQPCARARAVLGLGSIERRSKRKAAARDALEEAAAVFAGLPAPLWLDRARSEMARVGGRARATGDLTHTERRIAELAAQGKTNREIAGTLFLSTHTVENHLTRVFSKLGVRTRAELAGRARELLG